MKVLITGAGGQLGRDVVDVFEAAGHLVLGTDRGTLDITNQEQCMEVIQGFEPDMVIHCAAYTAVDSAESDVEGAYLVNAVGTRNVTVAAEKCGAKLIFISTDYVFDGQSEQPYQEYDNTDPKSVYGKSKRAGEVLVQSLSSRYFIVRTSWLYGLHGNNFVKKILQLAQNKPVLQVVNDQKGSPTYTMDLADFLLELSKTEKYGIYQVSNRGSCTWYEFTQAILEDAEELAGLIFTAKLEPCTTEQFPSKVPRPSNSVMAHLAICTNGFQDIRPWREGLRAFLIDFKNQLDF